MNIVVNHNTASQIECLDLHLREITLHDYGGCTAQIHFAKFFVQNARVLKTMRFGIKEWLSATWRATQLRLLELEKSASTEAVYELGTLST